MRGELGCQGEEIECVQMRVAWRRGRRGRGGDEKSTVCGRGGPVYEGITWSNVLPIPGRGPRLAKRVHSFLILKSDATWLSLNSKQVLGGEVVLFIHFSMRCVTFLYRVRFSKYSHESCGDI
jgi:hypothetical protein